MNKRPKPGEDYDDVLNEQIKFLEKNKPSAPVVRLERRNNENEKSNRKIEIEICLTGFMIKLLSL